MNFDFVTIKSIASQVQCRLGVDFSTNQLFFF